MVKCRRNMYEGRWAQAARKTVMAVASDIHVVSVTKAAETPGESAVVQVELWVESRVEREMAAPVDIQSILSTTASPTHT